MTASTCARAELAAPYTLGSLPPLEAQAFEAHLASGCDECEAELERARDTVARLDLKVAEAPGPEAGPSPELKDELLRRIEERDPRPWRRWGPTGVELTPGLTTVAGGEDTWEATDFDGVRVRRLSVDEDRRFVTMLVKMDAGASYPPHRHAGREECYVLEGDLQVADHELRAGDYQVAEEGSVHRIQSTGGGCTLLIVSSQDDVLIA